MNFMRALPTLRAVAKIRRGDVTAIAGMGYALTLGSRSES